jgi:hypothetical protein
VAVGLEDVGLGDGTHFTVEIWDAAARVSLNDGTEEELRNLFLGLGATAREADVAAQSILDWRDADGLHRPRGAEWADHYASLDGGVVPRNGRFQSVEEARSVHGLSDLYERAAPYLTVVGNGQINVNSAPAPVLRTIAGFSDETVAHILARQVTGDLIAGLPELADDLSEPSRELLWRQAALLTARITFTPRTLEIRSVGWHESNPVRSVIEASAVRSGFDVQIVRRIER